MDNITIIKNERETYGKIWGIAEYRKYSPAENNFIFIKNFLDEIEAKTVLDAGCGTGRLAQKLINIGFDVYGIDIASNCLDAGINIPFEVTALNDLSGHNDNSFDAILCFDVLEHLPSQLLESSIKELMRVCANSALFKIYLNRDSFGAKIGAVLHKTIMSSQDWVSLLKKYFTIEFSSELVNSLIVIGKKHD